MTAHSLLPCESGLRGPRGTQIPEQEDPPHPTIQKQNLFPACKKVLSFSIFCLDYVKKGKKRIRVYKY